jgi:competence CoiA-like predicted nuclease
MGKHRADVKTPTRVVEFQSSSISAEDIRARENHYGNMIWVLNGRKFSDNFYIRRRDGYHSFRWYHPRKSWWQAERMVLIDLPEEGLFMIEQIYSNVPCRGWGYYVDMALFMEMAGVPLRMEATA